jgi:all-trans-retinol 13,14-reductase
MPENQRWDAIVIGGGVGGTTAAAYLAAAGQRTLLLEQYDVVGGSSHVFRRKGQWEFDVGIHYLGDCGPGGQIPTLLRGLALDDRVEFTPMSCDGFDTIIRPDMEIRVPVGWDRYLEALIAAFPADERGLRRAFAVLGRLGRAIDRSTTPAGNRGGLRMARDAGAAVRWAMRPLSSLLDACGLSAQATAALTAHSGAYCCPPQRAPVAVHASFLENYVGNGAWFPRGGGQVLAAHLIDVIRGHGGTVRTRATVERILIESGRAVGVRLQDGESIRAGAVVSGADIKRTYLEMVGREHLRRSTVRRVGRWKMASPFVNLYLGVEVDLRERMPNTNYYYGPTVKDTNWLFDEIVDGGSRPRSEWLADMTQHMPAFVHCSTVKDPENPHVAPAGCSALEVMTAVPPAGELWSRRLDGTGYRRDPEYLELKEQLEATLLQRAEAAIPAIKGRVAWQELSTPLTHERYTRSSGGATYGLEPNTRQFGPFRPGCRTEIAGLYLAGAALAWGPGIEGSMLSGIHAAGALLSRELAREVRAGRVIADRSCLSQPDPDWDPLLASKRLALKRPAAVPA